jgi:thiamine-monophosphate kinase
MGAALGLSAEDHLIARHFQPLARHPGALGLQDDAAFYTPPPGSDLVLTADAIVGSVHFLPDDPPELIARKALRVNLSDLAAKGASPAGFLLSLGLPAELGDEWLAEFARGLEADIEEFGCPLLGGDSVRSPRPIMVSVAAFGTVPAGSMVRRGGANAGDVVMVTGSIGDAALGLRIRKGQPQQWGLSDSDADHLLQRYLLPQPRSKLAEALRENASAAMDVSDGLVGDFGKLCRVSGVSAEISAGAVPLSRPAGMAVKSDPALLEAVLTGGDDYEIVFTLPAERASRMQEMAHAAGIAVTEIGRTVAGDQPPRWLKPDGSVLEFEQTSFSHFA